jgi:hypothetical protein
LTQAASNLLMLIASARLHKLDPEAYLCDLFESCRSGRGTAISSSRPSTGIPPARAWIPQLAVEIGWLTVPPPRRSKRSRIERAGVAYEHIFAARGSGW